MTPRRLLRTTTLPALVLSAIACGASPRADDVAPSAAGAAVAPADETRVSQAASQPSDASHTDPQTVDPTPMESVAPGLNERFTAPDMDVQEWADRFEVESREVFAARQAITDALRLEPGDVIADVGAGTGLFVPLFSTAVGDEGEVVAVDISEAFVAHIAERAASTGLTNVRAALGEPADVLLTENSVDVVFTSDTYHHFEFPGPTLRSIARALRPGGELIIVDFERIEGVSSDFIMRHVRAPKEVVIAEIEAEGFELVEQVTSIGLVENYMLRFRAP